MVHLSKFQIMKSNQVLKKLRTEKGLSQEKMAELLNIEIHSYGRLERGESQLRFEMFLQILQILQVKFEDFIAKMESDSGSYVNYENSSNNTNNVYTVNDNMNFVTESFKDLIDHYKAEIEQLNLKNKELTDQLNK